jgi:hypothetical protein
MAFSDIEKWQDAFVNYSVPEIFQLNTQLRNHVTAKKQELRDLVGNRYRDMLKTADIIMEMNDVVSKEDESLSELCTSHRYSAWATHGQNVKMFLKSSERVDAVEGLLVRIVSFVKRHGRAIRKSQNYVLMARSIWLARVLLDQLNGSTTSLNIRKLQQLKANVDYVESVFSKTIEDLLLKGEESESIISYNNLFLAYCILNKVTAEEALQSMLAARLEFISSQFERSGKPEIVFPYILQHISSAYRIVKAGYKKNALTRLIYQQSEIFSLLDAPEFANQAELRIEKFKTHLPSDVQSLRAFPAASFNDIINSGRGSSKTSLSLANSLKTFGQSITTVLTNNLPSMLDAIDDLHTLVELYREVLILVQDTTSLRKLSRDGENDEDDETFYRSVFWPLWTKRFNEIVETEIYKLLNTEKKLSSIHCKLLQEKYSRGSASASSDYIFGKDFLSDFSDAKGVDYANILIHSLSSFASGSVGDIKHISDEYKTWVKSVSTIQSHVEEVSKMKALLSGKYPSLPSDDVDIGNKRTSTTDSVDDDDEDDYESAEFWRRTEKKLISTNHSVFSQHITKSLTNVHSELLAKITALSKTNINDKVGAFVLLIRAVLLLDAHFRKLGTAQDAPASESFLVSVYERLGDSIAKDLDAIDIDLYKPDEEERGPSLYISDYLTKLVKYLTNVLGDDELLWSNSKLTGLLRERVGHGIIEELKRVDKYLREKRVRVVKAQVAADTVVAEPDAAEESPAEPAQLESEKQQDEPDENSAEQVDSDETTTKQPVSEPEPSESSDEKSPIKTEDEDAAEEKPLTLLLTDYKYVSLLLGVTDPYFGETNNKSLVDTVKRTRILYLPLAL